MRPISYQINLNFRLGSWDTKFLLPENAITEAVENIHPISEIKLVWLFALIWLVERQ